MSWRALEPTPFGGWIRWAPRSWPATTRPHLDLAGGRIVWPAEGDGAPPSEPPEPPEVAYLPPVAADLVAAGAVLARRVADSGSVAIIGEHAGVPSSAERVRAVDLLDALLVGGVGEAASRLRSSPGGGGAATWIVVPLVPGLLGAGDELETLLDAVVETAPAAVLGVVPELSPADRRRLVEALGESSFDAVFHGRAVAERELARATAARGLTALPLRPPIPALGPRAARNRELAGRLTECGELWLRLGRRESEGVAMLAAGRRIEHGPHDVAALAREGNLALLDFLSAAARRVVEEWSAGSEELAAELHLAWTGSATA